MMREIVEALKTAGGLERLKARAEAAPIEEPGESMDRDRAMGFFAEMIAASRPSQPGGICRLS